MFTVFYNRHTLIVDSYIKNIGDVATQYKYMDIEYQNNIYVIYVDKIPSMFKYHMVVDNELISMSSQEMFEYDNYGYILSNEERLEKEKEPKEISLEDKVKELESIIDIMLGGIEDGL